MNEDVELMTVTLVARLFGVTRWSIFKWMQRIPDFPKSVTPAGCQIKFIKEEVLDYFYKRGK